MTFSLRHTVNVVAIKRFRLSDVNDSLCKRFCAKLCLCFI